MHFHVAYSFAQLLSETKQKKWVIDCKVQPLLQFHQSLSLILMAKILKLKALLLEQLSWITWQYIKMVTGYCVQCFYSCSLKDYFPRTFPNAKWQFISPLRFKIVMIYVVHACVSKWFYYLHAHWTKDIYAESTVESDICWKCPILPVFSFLY